MATRFAEGLLNGLTESFAGDGRVQVSRKHRPLSGLARPEFDDEMKAEEAPAARPSTSAWS